jgi:2-polyprenyl-3-methyl-5-hydroxy-6-metoxy-1,4-benzoquinol methylase
VEWRLFDEGTVPDYTTPEWYAGREHAPHLEQEGHRDRLMFTAAQIAREAMNGHRTLVDLGAGDGGLLSLLGPAIKAWGYDLQPSNIEHAQRRGVDVRLGDVLVDDIVWGGIAVATEILEHLVDPHGFVRRIAEHSRVLVCSSPRLETAEQHYEFHTWAFDGEGYKALVENNGWTVKRHNAVHGFQVIVAVKS